MMPAHRCSGCGHLVTTRRCPTCVQQFDQQRGSSSARGYGSARWRKLRARKLEECPLCSECERSGRLTGATEVDHLQRHHGPDDPLFWEWSNLDSKCKSCHSRKTASETINGDINITSRLNTLDRAVGNFSRSQLGGPAIG
jgi:5-methylcytosine-specific restriction endonuclease McrA